MHSRDLASLAGEETIFGGFAAEKLKRLQAELEPLSRRYDVVVANPPYMGSKNMNKWLGDWIKTHCKDVKGDLFSCFMMRNVGMGAEHAQLGFMTPYVWMFIGTYEKLRKFVIKQNTITSLIQLEYSGFSGATVPICTFTLQKGYCPGYRGGYVRLSDFVGADQQAPRALEALAHPNCGWFYRADANGFEVIPGSPIAYWIPASLKRAFQKSQPLEHYAPPKKGLGTGNKELFMRCWWEVGFGDICFDARNGTEAQASCKRWFPHNKGGEFRKWYGNDEYVVDWEDDGGRIKEYRNDAGQIASYPRNQDEYFKSCVSWSKISSGRLAFRYKPAGSIFNEVAPAFFSDKSSSFKFEAFLNSSVCAEVAKAVSPTLDFQVGQVASYPVLREVLESSQTPAIVESLTASSRNDWDSFEISYDFKHHPLI